METPLTLHTTREGDTTVVHACGEIDVVTAPQFRACLVAAAREGSAVKIDCTEVTFMDSTGVGTLLEAHGGAWVDGVRIVVSAVSPQVDKVLRLAGLAEMFGLSTA